MIRPMTKRIRANPGNTTERRGRQGDVGITDAIRKRIAAATKLLANGQRRSEVAKILKTSIRNIDDWEYTYPGIWKGFYDDAMERVREVVRAIAGTPGVFKDVDAYVLSAIRCDEWTTAKGEPLFATPDGTLTLPEFYERYYLPMRPQGKTTMEHHRIVLRRWRVLTKDPPLAEITKDTLALFRDALSKMRGLKPVGYVSPNTVACRLKMIQQFLDKAGPSSWRNRDAMEFIEKVPWCKPPKCMRRAVRIVSEETLNNFYLGCIAATQPQSPDFKPAAWWRAFVVLLYNVGIRRGTAFSLRMRWINWQKRCIVIPPEVTKTGQEQIIPMNQTVYDHLQAIRGEREYLFDWGRDIDRYFYTFFHRLQDACGIPKDEHFGLHQLRKTCATVLWEHNPQAAQFALGHTSLETTASFYVRGQAMLQRAVEQMPQPSAFGKAGGQ